MKKKNVEMKKITCYVANVDFPKSLEFFLLLKII